MRGARGAVRQDGNATRAAVTVAVAGAVESLTARMDARIDDVRDDLDEVRESVARVREWQAGHDAEHLIIPRPTTGGDA
ncbi:hypothetical protein [Streptomyces sp. NBC_00239]|uniref:hypothetical protein n=1 Tax=Streptomyces sp. NBC_00239 TaxID=2903640 RepID=UPI002E2A5C41|nr:hypothetical protein [Streptomyces sp. NBC_00239]